MKTGSKFFIIEKSPIIENGMKDILFSAWPNMSVLDVDLQDDICDKIIKEFPDALILNTILIQTVNPKKFDELVDCCKRFKVVLFALVHTYFNNDAIKQFDAVISINDSTESIIEIIKKELKKDRKINKNLLVNSISKREEEVIRYISLGLSNKEIADKMFISIHTVISHRKNITRKLGVKSTSAITIYAVLNKIIDENDFASSV